MAEPRPDRVEIDAGAEQMSCGRVPNGVGANAFSF